MKNILNSEDTIYNNFTDTVQDRFLKLRYGITRCSRPVCESLAEIRFELLEWCKNQDLIPGESILKPIVEAGANQIKEFPAVTGTVNGSYTPGLNPIVSQLWTKVSGPSLNFTTPSQLTSIYTGTNVGVYTLKLAVTDSTGTTYSDTMTVSILPGSTKIYYGYRPMNSTISEGDILSASFINVYPGQTSYTLPLNNNTTPSFVWFAELSTQPLKRVWQDTLVAYNQGEIGTEQDLFGPVLTIGDFRFYETEYLTTFDNPVLIKTI